METKIKKTNLVKSKALRSAGDDRKMATGITSGGVVAQFDEACDRGDAVAKIGVEKIKVSDKKMAEVPRSTERTLSNIPKEIRKKREEPVIKEPLSKIAEMKKIRNNYTFKNKFSLKRDGECAKNNVEKDEERPIKLIDDLPVPPNSMVSHKEHLLAPPNSMASHKEHSKSVPFATVSNRQLSPKSARRRSPAKTGLSQQLIRRPIIKTITSKNDKTKVYKAVNFVDRRLQPTPLEINIPTDRSKETKNKPLNKDTSKVSVKERRKKDKKRKAESLFSQKSAMSPVTVKLRSPPTEVAKWTSVDKHTKLYYEAWVDTTLAAISKKVKGQDLDSIDLKETFQKAFACRPMSPDVDYKILLDEKYTGKIKVNKR